MYYSEKITLKVVEKVQDSAGYPIETESKATVVYADCMSATRAEFYAAQSAGMKADAMFTVDAAAFAKAAHKGIFPNVVEYAGAVYDVVRTFTSDRYETQLTCRRRE